MNITLRDVINVLDFQRSSALIINTTELLTFSTNKTDD